jgi:hypothetical protein
MEYLSGLFEYLSLGKSFDESLYSVDDLEESGGRNGKISSTLD